MKRSRGNLPIGGGGGGGAVMSGGGSGGQMGGGGRQNSNLVSLVTPCNPVPASQSKRTPTLQDRDVKDLLVCGNCKEVFPAVERLLAHKKTGCRLRFVCRCKQTGEPRTLDCAYCGKELLSSWELVRHCQRDHDLTVFTTKSPLPVDPSSEMSEAGGATPTKPDTAAAAAADKKSDAGDELADVSAAAAEKLACGDARRIITLSRQLKKRRSEDEADDGDDDDEVDEVVLTEPQSPPGAGSANESDKPPAPVEEDDDDEEESDDEDSNRRRLRSRKSPGDKI